MSLVQPILLISIDTWALHFYLFQLFDNLLYLPMLAGFHCVLVHCGDETSLPGPAWLWIHLTLGVQGLGCLWLCVKDQLLLPKHSHHTKVAGLDEPVRL